MDGKGMVLGIDVGSVAISLALCDGDGRLIKGVYQLHGGRIKDRLVQLLGDLPLDEITTLAATNLTPVNIKADFRYNSSIALIETARHRFNHYGSILSIGGEHFGLLTFDGKGNYRNYHGNTSCAAGTGSFLDQQAVRLKLSGAEEISDLAYNNTSPIPKIASRCAVFAKTDLAHAQQSGYGLAEICDGLCLGMVKNIVAAVFNKGMPAGALLVCGGVAKNKGVIKHLRSHFDGELIIDSSGITGALGVALLALKEEKKGEAGRLRSPEDIFQEESAKKAYFHDPLSLSLSPYPDFNSHQRYLYVTDHSGQQLEVEVEVFEKLPWTEGKGVLLGLDIGSTSTKAVLLSPGKKVLAGFYTRTAGRPLEAVQAIFAAIDDLAAKGDRPFEVIGCATTGAGRKFIGQIINADLILDEITAHARGAVELNPQTDTIIEIGGQDAKFIILKNGAVTFAAMNSVCAAGTGSFVEELAKRWDFPLETYGDLVEGKRAPLTSDRCTVFMERDINYYLQLGYQVPEVMAALLHGVRDNYLTKVASLGMIGKNIVFQGATARNRALVAAFEQKLQRPIFVSKFCHLAGALGVALLMAERIGSVSKFRGLSLYRQKPSVRSEVCDICTNHCKITKTTVGSEEVYYGFLCGRDYDTKRYVDNNRSRFNLLRARKEAAYFDKPDQYRSDLTIGLPAALHILEDLPFWERFFAELSIKTVSSTSYNEALKDGTRLRGAEFCAPLTALYGHVWHLMKRADYVFLPLYLEKKSRQKGVRRQYCYYTQYAPGLVAGLADGTDRGRILMPLVNYIYSDFHTMAELYRTLNSILPEKITFLEVSKAYEAARRFKQDYMGRLQRLYLQQTQAWNDLHVVFLGRPYLVFLREMNKGIPEIFGRMGIQTFFQDMLQPDDQDIEPPAVLNELHWHYAAEVLKGAAKVAVTPGAYPVFITSFKCAPDSFLVDYFKDLMEEKGKPYLILQLDEHNLSTGYETRIEAALRTFFNHHERSEGIKKKATSPAVYYYRQDLTSKTLLLPNWDNLSMPLIAAGMQRLGIDARVLEESPALIQRSLRHNTGQCIPLNIIAEEFCHYIERHGLKPHRCALWLCFSNIACNIRLYPYHIKRLLALRGGGMEDAHVYVGSLSMADISIRLPMDVYFAYLFGGFLRRIVCRLRPHERHPGETDRVIGEGMGLLEEAFLGKRGKEETLREVLARLERIERDHKPRPKVAIFGDLYARDNEVLNQDLCRFIESHGGEVITTPYTSYLKMIAAPYLRKWLVEGNYLGAISLGTLLEALKFKERAYLDLFRPVLGELDGEFDRPAAEILADYHVRIEHTGESMDNLLKVFYLKRQHPDLALFIQTSPAFCCPSLVTEAMAGKIERLTGVPVLSLTYDGTGGMKNEAVIPYLKYPRLFRDEKNEDRSFPSGRRVA